MQKVVSQSADPGRNVLAEHLRTFLLISGMKDNQGREQVCEALRSVPGVLHVNVNLFRARAIVLHSSACPPHRLVRAVADTGHIAIHLNG